MKRGKLLAIVAISAMMAGSVAACGSKKADTESAKAKAKIVLVLEDKTEVPYEIEVTEGASIRDALFESKLISEEEYAAMFIANIDGHVADPMTDGVTWLPCDKDGNQLEAEIKGEFYCSADMIAVNDGDEIYLTYYTVPEAD